MAPGKINRVNLLPSLYLIPVPANIPLERRRRVTTPLKTKQELPSDHEQDHEGDCEWCGEYAKILRRTRDFSKGPSAPPVCYVCLACFGLQQQEFEEEVRRYEEQYYLWD